MSKLTRKEYLDHMFDVLVKHLLQLDDVGHYDPEKYIIMMYDYRITGKDLQFLTKHIEQVTSNYKFIVLSPGEQYSNILIEFLP